MPRCRRPPRIAYVDLDGTLCRAVPIRWRWWWDTVERLCPFVKLLLPKTRVYWAYARLAKRYDHVYVLTSAENRFGSWLWLLTRRFPHDGLIFTDSYSDKLPFIANAPYYDADLS